MSNYRPPHGIPPRGASKQQRRPTEGFPRDIRNPTQSNEHRVRQMTPISFLKNLGSPSIHMVITSEPQHVSVPGTVWRWNGGVVHALLTREHRQPVLILAWEAAFIERMVVALVVFLLLQNWLVRILASAVLAGDLARRRPLPPLARRP